MQTKFVFVGGTAGRWRVTAMRTVAGEDIARVAHVGVHNAIAAPTDHPAAWIIAGQISNLRYGTRAEVTALRAVQAPLGRPSARRAAMIPIKKTEAWWALAQDERRAIFEETSHHTAIGMAYLPAISRQLYHSRDLGEPFDFVTWFEYTSENEAAFDELLARLRATREWNFVEREIDIRLEAAA